MNEVTSNTHHNDQVFIEHLKYIGYLLTEHQKANIGSHSLRSLHGKYSVEPIRSTHTERKRGMKDCCADTYHYFKQSF